MRNNYVWRTYLLRIVSLTIPMAVISFAYDLPLLVSIIVTIIPCLPYIIPSETTFMICEFAYHLLLRPLAYIVALVLLIGGEQDFIAISYYIIMALQIVNMGKWFLFYTLGLIDIFRR